MSALRAEFKKLLTVRATYIWTLAVLAILCFIAFYAVGFKQTTPLLQPTYVQQVVFGGMQFVELAVAIIAILLLAHEYRYNIINYSLTLSNSRSKVLLSKFFVASVYAVFMALVSVGLIIGLVHAGAAVAGHPIAVQSYHIWHLLGQSVFVVWAYAMAGVIVVALFRNLVAAIAFLFIFPSIESLAGILLKHNVGYLPFSAIGEVTPIAFNPAAQGGFSITKSLIIAAIYIAVFAIISWQLFLRRDAG
jgi:ABC-type transport system involved in multi-copper enzyme maturation permease subunit